MDQIMVAFKGTGAGAGELSWGQSEIWSAINRLQSWMPLGGVKALDPGTTLDEVTAELRYLMSRYQSLRTRLRLPKQGRPWQVVHGTGEIALEIADATGADAQAAAETISTRYQETAMDFTAEWPIRMAVVKQSSILTHMVVHMSHFAIDGASGLVMMAEVAAKTQAPVDGLAPLAQARWQSSAAGQRQNTAALRYWEGILRTIEPRRFADPVEVARPRYHRGQFDSPVLASCVRRLTDRTGADSQAVLLTLYSLALHKVCGADPVVVRPLVNNRFRPGLSRVICTAVQSSICVLDIGGLSFSEALPRVQKASMIAYKNAYFDPSEVTALHQRIEHERGKPIDIACYFNDKRTGMDVPADLDGPSTFTWLVKRDSPGLERLIVDAEDIPGALRLILHMDAHALSPADGEAILRTTELLAAQYADD